MKKLLALLLTLLACAIGSVDAAGAATAGPLTHSPGDAHFSDNQGNRVYLTGSHTWDSLQDYGDSRPDFDYELFLDQKVDNGHNFIRLWVWESTSIGDPTLPNEDFQPMPWVTGTGGRFDLYDGDPSLSFDDSKVIFNPSYFTRLFTRVNEARLRGIYVDVMLFQGWSVYRKRFTPSGGWCPFKDHPWKLSNNNDGVDADFLHTSNQCSGSDGEELHTLNLANPQSQKETVIANFQKAYVRKVLDTLKDLDNVLYEISNESICDESNYPGFCTKDWQYEMIAFIKQHQNAANLMQHPVGMTAGADNVSLFASSADWVSPSRRGSCSAHPPDDYALDPPEHDGSKVILADTDHISCVRSATNPRWHRQWTWKSLTRGYNPIMMDAAQNPFNGNPGSGADPTNPVWPDARRYLGEARSYAERLDLATAVPSSALCGTGYCLAAPGSAYLVYQPDPSSITVNLVAGTYDVEWFDPRNGHVFALPPLAATGGDEQFDRPPGFDCGGSRFACDAVLLLSNGTPATAEMSALAVADAYVSENNDLTNFGSQSDLQIRHSPTDHGRFAFFEFDVPPFSGNVVSATLRIRTRGTPSPGITPYKMSNMAWGESTINYYNWDQLGSVEYTSLGTTGSLAADTWHEIDVTSGMSGAGPITFGLASPFDQDSVLWSRESGFKPELRIVRSTSPSPLVVPAAKDAWVSENQATTNFGSSTELRTRLDPIRSGRFSFLRFTVPAYQGTLLSAKLRIHTMWTQIPSASFYKMHNMGSWNELAIHWLNWDQAGSVTFELLTSTGVLAANAQHEIDVTSAIAGPGTLLNLGIASGEDLANLKFWSRESVTLTPELVVTYQPDTSQSPPKQ